ncbi:hypothetical protein DPMN_114874 [Dreissena polymorpha]|uniref:Uncharacterized protein n=1 Tax=Dreissena polymorpha TaxID=45954 RepID=A0A9D4QRZ0_DREPO|nr:hypothetical protein DPMN_114874 [Dreissena polymorpha]
MTYSTPKRRSVSKHTIYPTVHSDKKHFPSEVSPAARARLKNIENDSRVIQNAVRNVHMKSLSHLISQRKLLEKSMLEYSNKMKEINESRTNELFREIHTGTAAKSDDRISSKSDTVSSKSNASSKSLLQTTTASKSKHNLSQTAIPSPVPEIRLTRERRIRPMSEIYVRYGMSPTPRNSAMSMVAINKRIDDYIVTGTETLKVNKAVPETTSRKQRLARGKLLWSPALEGADSSDSAYSSGTDDVELTAQSAYTETPSNETLKVNS